MREGTSTDNFICLSFCITQNFSRNQVNSRSCGYPFKSDYNFHHCICFNFTVREFRKWLLVLGSSQSLSSIGDVIVYMYYTIVPLFQPRHRKPFFWYVSIGFIGPRNTCQIKKPPLSKLWRILGVKTRVWRVLTRFLRCAAPLRQPIHNFFPS